jgi:hypothetical protein
MDRQARYSLWQLVRADPSYLNHWQRPCTNDATCIPTYLRRDIRNEALDAVDVFGDESQRLRW